MPKSMCKVIELIGSSKEVLGKGCRVCRRRSKQASTGHADSQGYRAGSVIENGKVIAYHTKLKVSLKYKRSPPNRFPTRRFPVELKMHLAFFSIHHNDTLSRIRRNRKMQRSASEIFYASRDDSWWRARELIRGRSHARFGRLKPLIGRERKWGVERASAIQCTGGVGHAYCFSVFLKHEISRGEG